MLRSTLLDLRVAPASADAPLMEPGPQAGLSLGLTKPRCFSGYLADFRPTAPEGVEFFSQAAPSCGRLGFAGVPKLCQRVHSPGTGDQVS